MVELSAVRDVQERGPAPFERAYPRIHLLDPGNFTPAYDLSLSTALMARGWFVEWITSRHEFENPDVPEGLVVQQTFFAALHREPVRSWLHLRERSRLRRFAKALCYPIELGRLAHRLKRQPPGILHVQWALMPRLDTRCWQALRAIGWRVVHTVHDPTPLAGSMPRVTSATTDLLRAADALIVHGASARRNLIERHADPRRVFRIPLASTVRHADCTRPTRAQARRTLDLPQDAAVVLFFGYVKPYKGLDVLLEGIARVKTAIPNLLVLIAGEVLERKAEYCRTVADLGLASNVRWTDEYVPERLVPSYFAASNVVALPYLAASSSAVLASAQEAGRAAIASDVGDLREAIDSGRTGLLVPGADVAALASGLTRLLANPSEADAMGQAAAAAVRAERAWPQVAHQLADIYELVWQARDR